MQVIVNDVLITYSRSGKGQQVLVLHGWADASANWRTFVAELAKDCEVIVPDLPGFGGSQAPATAWGLDDYAVFAAAFCQKLNVKPTVIIGHSNGGAIAIRGLAKKTLSTD